MPLESADNSVRRAFATVTSVLVLAVGCTVMYGWIIGSSKIVQLQPGWASMKFNTALCFVMLGAGALLRIHEFRRAAFYCALLVFGIGAATSAEYAFGLDLKIDVLFVQPFFEEARVYPGRMSPITAALFVLSGGALALLSTSQPRTRLVGLIASIIAGVASAAVIGYVTRTPTAYGWNAVVSVAAHTAVCFLFVAAMLAALAVRPSEQYWPDWLPWGALIAGLACTMALGAALYRELPGRPHSLVPELVVAIGVTTSALVTMVLRARAQLAAQRDLLAAALRRREEAMAKQAASEQRLRESLQDRELLLKEIHHRVKNNLQVVASMLALQSHRTDQPKVQELLENCRRRVISMASVHEKLYGVGDLRRLDLGELIRGIAGMLISDDLGIVLAVQFDVQHVVVDIEKAFPASLLVNELILNAVKHAFAGRTRGSLSVGLWRRDGIASVRVADDGVGGVSADMFVHGTTLGATIVRSFVRQLDGSLQMHSEVGIGTEIIVSFPVA